MTRKVKKTWAQVLNNVKAIYEDPCSLNWSLIIDTAIPAAGKAILFLVSPSPLEMLRRYTIPKLGRKAPKGLPRKQPRNVVARGGAVRRAFAGGLPDPAEWIASKIPGRAYFANRVPGFLERLFWINVQRIEAVLWYFLVLGTLEEFLYEWSSGIMASHYCHAQYPLVFSGSLDLSCQAFDNIVRISCMGPSMQATMNTQTGALRENANAHFAGNLWLTGKALNNTAWPTNGQVTVNGITIDVKPLQPGDSYDWAVQVEITDSVAVQITEGIFFPGATIQAAQMVFLGDYV